MYIRTLEHSLKIRDSRRKNGKPWHSDETKMKCRSFGMQGKHQSVEAKLKIGVSNSTANRGKDLSLIHKEGCLCSRCRMVRGEQWCNEEVRQRNLQSALQSRSEEQKSLTIQKRSGTNHFNWKGGKSFEPYPLGWTKTYKEQIRYRDGYRCQLCGKPEIECREKLNVHHIDYDKENISESNLISLCRKCHMKTNYNRDRWVLVFRCEER